MNESEMTRWLSGLLKGAGALVFKVHGHAMQAAGWPDVQVYHPGWTGHLELKVEDNKLTELQAHVMRELLRRGTAAATLRYRLDVLYLEAPDGRCVGTRPWARNDDGLLAWLSESCGAMLGAYTR